MSTFEIRIVVVEQQLMNDPLEKALNVRKTITLHRREDSEGDSNGDKYVTALTLISMYEFEQMLWWEKCVSFTSCKRWEITEEGDGCYKKLVGCNCAQARSKHEGTWGGCCWGGACLMGTLGTGWNLIPRLN